MATITASQSLQLRNPNTSLSTYCHKPLPFNHVPCSPFSVSLRPLFPLLRHSHKPYPQLPKLKVLSSTSIPTLPSNSPSLPPVCDATRTISSIFATGLSLCQIFLKSIQSITSNIQSISVNPTSEELAKIHTLKQTLVCSVGPLFFAALKDRPSGYLNTPLTVVASGMAKWLDIYSGVLMVRVLLSWFPNIPWDRQPLSAIRDLCDPYLNLFRNIIPPIFNTLDVSPLLAFAVLGTLGSILNNSRGSY
ncbi:hypothetical protein Nepgr_009909 [Nepenthes gracilis]|uniref:Uncharacterized protein n=1 Tax=Nepenthes gracilis TaxID=150966 RepID=A0AAD3XKT2_NEPGR|nr:hypothetical protein Nepgr_009909 [Nepenthes gracilis]